MNFCRPTGAELWENRGVCVFAVFACTDKRKEHVKQQNKTSSEASLYQYWNVVSKGVCQSEATLYTFCACCTQHKCLVCSIVTVRALVPFCHSVRLSIKL